MVESIITEGPSLPKDVKLRSASLADLNALLYVCRECYPEYYRWRSIYPVGKKWWSSVLQSQSCQTTVLEDSSGIFALNVLVLDYGLWRAESKRRNGSLISRTVSVLCCPFPAVWKRLLKIAVVRLTYRRPGRNGGPRRTNQRPAWSENTAVLPRMRRKGFTSLLIQARNQRALEAGATVVQTHIESWNVAARRMNEKNGYVLVSEDARGCIYEKSLVNSGLELV